VLGQARAVQDAFNTTNDPAELARVADAFERVVRHPAFGGLPPPIRSVILTNLGQTLRLRYDFMQQREDLEEAINALRQSADSAPPGASWRAAILESLGHSLYVRHNLTQDLRDLDEALKGWKQAVDLVATGRRLPTVLHYLDAEVSAPAPPERAELCNAIGAGYHRRFAQSQRADDIGAAISAFADAVQAADSPELRARYLSNLGRAQRKRGTPGDLDAAVVALRDAIDLTPPGGAERSGMLRSLGNALRDRHAQTRSLDDLERAARAYEQAVNEVSAHAPDRHRFIEDLVNTLGSLSRLTGQDEYAERMAQVLLGHVSLAGVDVPLTPGAHMRSGVRPRDQSVLTRDTDGDVHADHLVDQAVGLLARYDEYDRAEDLTTAIATLEQVDALRDVSAASRARCLTNLGICLRRRYERQNQTTDLDRAIDCLRNAVSLTEENAQDGPKRLNNLANALVARGARDGSLPDFSNAVDALRKALDQTSPTDARYAQFLVSLSAVLGSQYGRSGEWQDLEEAKKAAQEALHAGLGVRDRASCLANLGVLLLLAFTRDGRPDDLDAAVSTLREAVETVPPNRSADALSNLGSAVLRRYEHADSHNIEDLRLAVTSFQQAIDATSPNAPARADYLTNLGVGLRQLYERERRDDDLDRALAAAREAVAATKSTELERAPRLLNLASVLVQCHLRDKRSESLDAAQAAFREARGVGIEANPEAALSAARQWGDWALGRSAWNEAAEAYDYGTKAMERLLAAQLLRQDKESWLRSAQGLTTNGAYAFARCGELTRAAQIVEGGRVRLLAEALERDRADLERLRELGHGELLQRYKDTATEWTWLSDPRRNQERAWHAHAAARSQLESCRGRLEALVEEIRRVAGYEDFLTSPGLDEIAEAAADCPLVYIVASSVGGVALIVQGNKKTRKPLRIDPVWLPTLTQPILREKLIGEPASVPAGYLGAYKRRTRRDRLSRAQWMAALEDMTQWLWDSVMGPLLEALAALLPGTQMPVGQSVPQAVLVPTGLLGLLSLHAAWCRDAQAPTGRRFALDSVCWRYAPSARALNAGRARLASLKDDNLLLVEEPLPVSAARLRFSGAEAKSLVPFWPKSSRASLTHRAATHDDLSSMLPQYAVLHYVGHAFADWRKPRDGGLLLAGDRVLTVGELQSMPLKMRLAVLSACETGMPGPDLPDEMVGLPAAFVEAGAAGVLASLWSVPDVTTRQLMEDFYKHWRGAVESLEPAQALRRAQLALRSDPTRCHPYYWAAFAYTGS
jgi:hypothetical protein